MLFFGDDSGATVGAVAHHTESSFSFLRYVRWSLYPSTFGQAIASAFGHLASAVTPTSAWQTPEAMEELCQLYQELRDKGQVPSLVLDAMFVFDFLSIHPFADGNGRMARLLTLWALYQGGYEVGRYISLEKLVEESKDQYYKTLQQSSQGWHNGGHDVSPWLEYYLTIVLRSYQKLEENVGGISTKSRGWKKKKIESVVENFIADFAISDLLERCPGIARPTITRTLNELRKQGVIECVEHGRNARWRKLK